MGGEGSRACPEPSAGGERRMAGVAIQGRLEGLRAVPLSPVPRAAGDGDARWEQEMGTPSPPPTGESWRS